MLALSAVAFMQHIPYARVRIHSGAFFIHKEMQSNFLMNKNTPFTGTVIENIVS
jgi:hypothetical protein